MIRSLLSNIEARAAVVVTFRPCHALIVIGVCLAVLPAFAMDEKEPTNTGHWIWSVSIGMTSWGALEDIESATGGQFDSIGFSLELAGHKRVSSWGSADVLLGADLGLFTTDGDIPGISQDYTQRGLYLTPSVKFRFGERTERYLNLEAGAGWYNVDFAELDCDTGGSLCVELRDPFDADALGMYVGVSAGFGSWLVTGLRVHYADFGQVTGINSVSGDLKGPFYVLSLGAAFGN